MFAGPVSDLQETQTFDDVINIPTPETRPSRPMSLTDGDTRRAKFQRKAHPSAASPDVPLPDDELLKVAEAELDGEVLRSKNSRLLPTNGPN